MSQQQRAQITQYQIKLNIQGQHQISNISSQLIKNQSIVNQPTIKLKQLTNVVAKQVKNNKNGGHQSEKSQYSRSYMYSIPHMDAKYQQQLSWQEKGITKYSRKIAFGLFVFLLFFQANLFVLYFLNYFLDGENKRVSVLILLCSMAVISLFWTLKLYRTKNGYNKSALCFVFLIVFSCVAFIGGVVSAFVKLWYIFLIVWVLSCVFCFIFSRKPFNNLIFCLACSLLCPLAVGFTGFLMFYTIFLDDLIQGLIYACINLGIFGISLICIIFAAINQFLIRNYGDSCTFFALLTYIHVISVGVTYSISGIVKKQNLWVYLTQITNLIFIITLIFYIYIFVRKQNLKVYQISRSLLTYDKNLKTQKQQSKKPLNPCIVCLSQQSRFYYQNCMHVCCGYACILSWLKNKQLHCPMCRKQSVAMIEIQRIKQGQFKVLSKYSIRS